MDDNSAFYESLAERDLSALSHYGTPRHSGRYPWGSGEDPFQSHKGFLNYVSQLKKEGFTTAELVEAFGLENSNDLRNRQAIARNQLRAAQIAQAVKLQKTGMSAVAIGKEMKINESTVRSLLNPVVQANNAVLQNTADYLKAQVDKNKYIDVGAGAEHYLNGSLGIGGISQDKLKVAIAMLKNDGYKMFYVKAPQQTTGEVTKMKVLAGPDAYFPDLAKDLNQIVTLTGFSDDMGETIKEIKPPRSVPSDRITVRYAEEGGVAKDGLIELRRGVPEVSLQDSRYAQVRIAVDDSHYLKGMAVYSDDLPDGVDIRFNTNKSDTGNKLDAMKPLKDDPEMPFGSIVRQRYYTDADGKEQQSPLNIVNEEGDWHKWSRNLSSQFLSKQSNKLAREQLDAAYQQRVEELAEINRLTNPSVKKKLLEEFADGADSAAQHLKAAGLPRTRSQVIIPIASLKDNEIYAPNYNEGEKVVLVRHPHAGTFEIPELIVKNGNREANRILKGAKDAVGINANVAQRLSGADFDGDTVLVIPNNGDKVKNTEPLAQLKNFDHQKIYAAYDGMRTIDGGIWDAATRKKVFPEGTKASGKNLQAEMGKISNLITDMTVRGANRNELARAAAHSMVVIDSEKHSLNYRQSALDHDIKGLRKRYQDGGGASTLISLAKADAVIPQQRLRRVNEEVTDPVTGEVTKIKTPGPIDPDTGAKVWVPTGEGWIDKKTGDWVPAKTRTTKMRATEDAFELSSGTAMEAVYATHANKMKALANNARKEWLDTPPAKQNKSAREVYNQEVLDLGVKLRIAEQNKPLERKAQLIAGANVAMKVDAHSITDKGTIKKLRAAELNKARIRLGARKQRIEFTDSEWAAVQAGAISTNMLEKLLANSDMEKVRERATPRVTLSMTPAKVSQARAMMERGYTAAQVAEKMGVSTSAIYTALEG